MSQKRKKRQKTRGRRDAAVLALDIASLFLPTALYLLCTLAIFPAPSSAFLIVGLFAAISMGVGCIWLTDSLLSKRFNAAQKRKLAGKSLLLSLPSAAILAFSCFSLYLPALRSDKLEEAMSAFLINLAVLLLILIFYGAFRQSVKECLHTKGHSKTLIRKTLRENRGRLLFWPFRRELGALYGLNFCLLLTVATVLLLLPATLFWPPVRSVIGYFEALSMLLHAAAILPAGYQSDFRLFAIGKKKGSLIECLLLAAFSCYCAVRLLMISG